MLCPVFWLRSPVAMFVYIPKVTQNLCTMIQSRQAIELKQLYGLIVTTNSLTHSLARTKWYFPKDKTKEEQIKTNHTRVSTEGLNEIHALTSNAHHWLLALYAHNGIESVSVILVKTFHRLEDWFRAFVRCARDRRFTWRRPHAISFTFIRFVRAWRFGVIVSVSVTLRTARIVCWSRRLLFLRCLVEWGKCFA